MMSIRLRLLAMLLISLTLVLVAGGASVHWVAKSNLLSQFDDALETRAKTLASLVSDERGRLTFDSGDAPVSLLTSTFFEIKTDSGQLLKRSRSLDKQPLPDRPETESGDLLFDDVVLADGIHARLIWYEFQPKLDDEDEEDEVAVMSGPPLQFPGTLIVTAAVDREPVDRASATMLGALLLVGAAVGASILIIVTLGVRWGLVPLGTLRRQLSDVTGRNLSDRLDETSAPLELLPVYHELNRMLDRVEEALERERSFAGAAAHELRTPLAELRATAEVAVRWPDLERAGKALDEVLGIGREMERLVETLLLVSRGRTTAIQGQIVDVQMAPLVQHCVDRAKESVGRNGWSLRVDVDETSTIRAPHDAMEIIVRNLIDNAFQYTPADGTVAIRQERNGNGCRVLVVENGPVGLQDTDLPRMFEPFWRTEQSRTNREHVGLGMSVVQHIARAIGFEVDAKLAGDHLQMRLVPAIDEETS